MELPNLMPYQECPFNGDTFIEKKFLELKERFKLTSAVETGTCLGSTTAFLSRNFDHVYTIEISEEFANIAKARLEKLVSYSEYLCLTMYRGKSEEKLPVILKSHNDRIGDNTIFFLDAHWGDHCPLKDELKAIADAGIKPVIAIHDFFVPGAQTLGHDVAVVPAEGGAVDFQPFDFPWLEESFNKIYGEKGYAYEYNSDEKSMGAKRGIIYVYPRQMPDQPEKKDKSEDAGREELLNEFGNRTKLTSDQPGITGKFGSAKVVSDGLHFSEKQTRIAFDEADQPVQQEKISPALMTMPIPADWEDPMRLYCPAEPPAIVLYVNYYADMNNQRRNEIDNTLIENIKNQDIDMIYMLVGVSDAQRIVHEKIRKFVLPDDVRPTYHDFFDIMRDTTWSENQISILANVDVYITPTMTMMLKDHMKTPFCFALSHWDKLPDGSYRHERIDQVTGAKVVKQDQQDVWVFKGEIKDIQNCDFTMGRPGCDNAIAKCIQNAGYFVANPSKDIRPVHNHLSEVRNYNTTQVGKGDNPERIEQEYLILPPTSIADLPMASDNSWLDNIALMANNSSKDKESQFEEDAVIDYILSKIQSPMKMFVDLGAGAYGGSRMSNTRTLVNKGWKGIAVDAKPQEDKWIKQHFVRPDNIVDFLLENGIPKNFDFLNLDIDSSDFWVLKEILTQFRPRLICTEFNGTLDPNESLVLKYEEGYTWDETNKYGYSFAAGKKLLEENNYTIVYNLHNVNIFAIRNDLIVGQHLLFPVTAKQEFYHPVNPNAVWEKY